MNAPVRSAEDIAEEHRSILLVTRYQLLRLAKEHKESKGYLTSSSVAWEGQAERIRQWLALAEIT